MSPSRPRSRRTGGREDVGPKFRQRRYRKRQKARRDRRSPVKSWSGSSDDQQSGWDSNSSVVLSDGLDEGQGAPCVQGLSGVGERSVERFPQLLPLTRPLRNESVTGTASPVYVYDDAAVENALSAEVADTARQETAMQPQVPEQEEARNPAWLARELTKISCFGDVSEASMEKVTRLFMGNLDAIKAMRSQGLITDSYKHSIAKRLDIAQPTVKCAFKYVDNDKPDEDPVMKRDLPKIPAKYLNPTLWSNYNILRTEAYVSLKDIKSHYEQTHPHVTGESLRIAYSEACLGIDGVREANSGSRTLIVVSVMLAGCVFVWKIYNPYKGEVNAKPTAEELLRYVSSIVSNNNYTRNADFSPP